MLKRKDCYCQELNIGACLECEQVYAWSRLTQDKKVFALRWLKAEKKLDAIKSLSLYNERDKNFPGWDFTPEDIPSEIWRKN